MAKFSIKTNIDDLLRQIRRKNESFSKSKIDEAMFRIGTAIVNQAKINARNKDIYDTGNLINNIAFRTYGSSGRRILQVGVFGVSYAAVNEYGSNNITDQVRRAMFRSLRERGKIGLPGKGIMVGSSFKRRPFLNPAHRQKRLFLTILRDTLRK